MGDPHEWCRNLPTQIMRVAVGKHSTALGFCVVVGLLVFLGCVFVFFLLFVLNSLGPLRKCCCGKCRSWVGETKWGFWEDFAPGLSEVTSLRGRLHVYLPPGGTRRTWFCWLNFMVCSCLGSIWREQEFLASRVKLATNEALQMFFGVLWCSDPRGQAGESISGRWRSRPVLQGIFSINTCFLCDLQPDRRTIFIAENEKCQHQQNDSTSWW